MQDRFFTTVSQSVWVIFSGMSPLPNWSAAGISIIAYQWIAG
jgi:hypothetical protein